MGLRGLRFKDLGVWAVGVSGVGFRGLALLLVFSSFRVLGVGDLSCCLRFWVLGRPLFCRV